MRKPTKAPEWERIRRPVCDVCWRLAVWWHQDGGLRCNACPRPASKKPTRKGRGKGRG